MSNELVPPVNPSNPNPFDRGNKREIRAVVDEARLDSLRLRAKAHVTADAMEKVVDIDLYRRQLSGGDEFLNQQLGLIEMMFIAHAGRIVKGF